MKADTHTTITVVSDPWTAAILRAACRLLAGAPGASLIRLQLDGPISGRSGGALELLRLANRLAEEYGLGATLALHPPTMTLTFTRREAARRARGQEDAR